MLTVSSTVNFCKNSVKIWVLEKFEKSWKKTCLGLHNSQPWLRSVRYVNGPHDAVVLSLWATRPKLRAIRPQGHKKGVLLCPADSHDKRALVEVWAVPVLLVSVIVLVRVALNYPFIITAYTCFKQYEKSSLTVHAHISRYFFGKTLRRIYTVWVQNWHSETVSRLVKIHFIQVFRETSFRESDYPGNVCKPQVAPVCLLGPTRVHNPNGISIGSAILDSSWQSVVGHARACPFP